MNGEFIVSMFKAQKCFFNLNLLSKVLFQRNHGEIFEVTMSTGRQYPVALKVLPKFLE